MRKCIKCGCKLEPGDDYKCIDCLQEDEIDRLEDGDTDAP